MVNIAPPPPPLPVPPESAMRYHWQICRRWQVPISICFILGFSFETLFGWFSIFYHGYYVFSLLSNGHYILVSSSCSRFLLYSFLQSVLENIAVQDVTSEAAGEKAQQQQRWPGGFFQLERLPCSQVRGGQQSQSHST